jgi:hypothetical protein
MRTGPAYTWGTSAPDRSVSFPCEHHLPGAEDAYFRGLDIAAPAAVLFRWLCQLRVAPYSYDWIDNRGRRSPRSLTAVLERLSVGQSVMTIFKIVEFEVDRHLTIMTPRPSRLFGEVAVTYLIIRVHPSYCRLLVKVLVRHPPAAPLHRLGRELLPWGDVIMMRRQMLNLKHLAEHEP